MGCPEMKLQGICFDMDGVLTDTENLSSRMLNLACRRQGFELPPAAWMSVIGTSLEHTCRFIRSRHPDFDCKQFQKDWSEVTFQYVEQNGVPVKQGAEEVLQSLTALGFRLALCTNNIPSVVHRYLDILKWKPYFQVVLTSHDVIRRKPDPETYLRACQLLDLTPQVCIGIEDSPSGIKAVHTSGMTCIHIPDLIVLPKEYSIYVDVSLTSLQEILTWIKTSRKE